MQETQLQSLSQKDTLEKKMATPSSIFAWSIPWKEEPGGALPPNLIKCLVISHYLSHHSVIFTIALSTNQYCIVSFFFFFLPPLPTMRIEILLFSAVSQG